MYYYNDETLRYEPVKKSKKVIFLNILGTSLLVLVLAFGFSLILDTYFPSQKELALKREVGNLENHLAKLNTLYDKMSSKLNHIQETDANVHRMVFGMEPIDGDIWQAGIGGHDAYKDLAGLRNADILKATLQKAEKLGRQLDIQEGSLKEIHRKAMEKEKEFAAIPSIKPVRSDKLNRDIKYLSGFGYRIHPIYKRRKFHAGIDFSAPKGTKIFSTGDGVVTKIENKRTGYGLNVTIDHGFGYKTLYAHMGSIKVKKGQKVKRGQIIGSVGNTGTSTAPHLHYEVIKDGKKVNPIHYVMDGLSTDEYMEIVKASGKMNQSFD